MTYCVAGREIGSPSLQLDDDDGTLYGFNRLPVEALYLYVKQLIEHTRRSVTEYFRPNSMSNQMHMHELIRLSFNLSHNLRDRGLRIRKKNFPYHIRRRSNK